MKILDYIYAARPLLHLPVWSIYLVSLHFHHELSGKSFSIDDIIILIGLSLAASGAYFINQIYDYKSDLLNKKLGFLQQNRLTIPQMMTAYMITAIGSIFISSFYTIFLLFIFLQLFVFGYIYSAPPLRLKDRPITGLLANAYCFGFLIPLSVMPEMTTNNTGLLGWDNPIYFFLTVAAIYVLTTIPDLDGDKKSSKKTIAVILPIWLVKILGLLLMLLSGYVAYNSGFQLLVLISIISSIPIIISLIIPKNSLTLLAIKFPILLLTILAGYFYPAYLLFVVALIIITRIYYKKRFDMIYPKLT